MTIKVCTCEGDQRNPDCEAHGNKELTAAQRGHVFCDLAKVMGPLNIRDKVAMLRSLAALYDIEADIQDSD